jgi:hypothetical protein
LSPSTVLLESSEAARRVSTNTQEAMKRPRRRGAKQLEDCVTVCVAMSAGSGSAARGWGVRWTSNQCAGSMVCLHICRCCRVKHCGGYKSSAQSLLLLKRLIVVRIRESSVLREW